MAQIITTGPAHIFIGRSALDADLESLEYLGTCQKSPGITIQTIKEDVMNDIGGETPISYSNQGQVAQIKMTLNRYDESVFAKIATGLFSDGLNRGEITRAQMGALAQGMGFDFYVLFYFPFHQGFLPGSRENDHTTSHPQGIHFTSVVPTKEKLSEMGTRARTASLELRCIPKMYFTNTNIDSNGTSVGPVSPSIREFVLYNHIKTVSANLIAKVN
jgi:hypothetical protein